MRHVRGTASPVRTRSTGTLSGRHVSSCGAQCGRFGSDPLRVSSRRGWLVSPVVVTAVITAVITVEVDLQQAPYGEEIEFGTSYMEAQPYMRPAFDEAERQETDEIADELRREIERPRI